MSDTTGWSRDHDGDYSKIIDGLSWHIWSEKERNTWYLAMGIMDTCRATRPTLRECQILAHETARLWAGENHD